MKIATLHIIIKQHSTTLLWLYIFTAYIHEMSISNSWRVIGNCEQWGEEGGGGGQTAIFWGVRSAFKTQLLQELRQVLSGESPAVFLHFPLLEKGPWGPLSSAPAGVSKRETPTSNLTESTGYIWSWTGISREVGKGSNWKTQVKVVIDTFMKNTAKRRYIYKI